MNKTSLGILTGAALLLAACGGGGGDGPNVSLNENGGSQNRNGGSTNNGGSNNSGSQTQNRIAGNYYTAKIGGSVEANKATLATNAVNVLKIGNQEIPLDFGGGISAGTFYVLNGNTTINGKQGFAGAVSGDHVRSMKYGVIENGSGGKTVFAQGELTQNMPASGTAKFSGYHVYTDASGAIVTAADNGKSANFDVDFGKKTLTGKLASAANTFNVSANINGNSFKGTSSDKTVVQGNFFGSGAAEMGGTFRNDAKKITGAFGAVKQ